MQPIKDQGNARFDDRENFSYYSILVMVCIVIAYKNLYLNTLLTYET